MQSRTLSRAYKSSKLTQQRNNTCWQLSIRTEASPDCASGNEVARPPRNGLLRLDGVLGPEAWSRGGRSDPRRVGRTEIRSAVDGGWAELAGACAIAVAGRNGGRGGVCGVEYVHCDCAVHFRLQHLVRHGRENCSCVSFS